MKLPMAARSGDRWASALRPFRTKPVAAPTLLNPGMPMATALKFNRLPNDSRAVEPESRGCGWSGAWALAFGATAAL